MLYFLQNENYKVGVESLGAELQHFIKLDEQLEFIWQADPNVWASHAPNLFPIVGELPDAMYTFQGNTYPMLRHGFARHKEFKLVDEHHDKLVFELTHDDETLAQYPFKFTLLVAYILEWNKLSVTYLVRCDDDHAMYFSVGGHPAFNVPFYPNENYTDYYLEFEQEETLSRYLLNEQGLQNGDTERVLEQERVLHLNHEFFEKDALVFKNLNSEKVALSSSTNPRSVEIEFQGFPYLGVWAKPGPSQYLCIEPWCGIAGRVGESGELQDKEGIQEVGPKQAFERTFTITIL
ncbi:aldose 1-epimerase family protein [Pontibacter pudoricolor]|uniref:aldose 1-epimerase family protein n=1 Tax=Pontibacter pudoricolor TaxID=2694930 RepID=UPI001391191D|nr:aldose 1-epimerase family protein [Pontibacter pudoricolor]